jgi:hypothetical protein
MMAIQIKLMKVSSNTKNTPIQEFQFDMESQLIEVLKKKMHPIQFVSMMTVIQMKLMKVIDIQESRDLQEFSKILE